MTKCDSIYADIPMQLYIKIARQKGGGDSYYINVARKQRQLQVSRENNSYIYPLFNFLILDFLYYTKISKIIFVSDWFNCFIYQNYRGCVCLESVAIWVTDLTRCPNRFSTFDLYFLFPTVCLVKFRLNNYLSFGIIFLFTLGNRHQ